MNTHIPSVLFLNRVFPPAQGATGQLLADLAAGLAAQGWRVTVLTARISRQAAREETVQGVRIVRVTGWPAVSTRPDTPHWRRALGYVGLYPALLTRALRLSRHDLVVTMTDPPLQLALGPILKRWKRSRVLHWAQDLYPEVAEVTGVLRPQGLAASFLRRLSTRALLDADRVVAVGRCMKEKLARRGLAPDSIDLIPNWAPKGLETPSASSPTTFRWRHGWGERFVLMYSGNLGLAHRFEAILEAAELMQERLPKALFLFVGDGPKLGWVRREVAWRRLSNVQFLPAQPREGLVQSLAAAHVHLASMREDLLGLVVPSKVYGILAAGRPCVFVGPRECEVARLIEEHQCGSVCSPNDGRLLAEDLLSWFFDLNRYQEAGRRACQAAQQFHAQQAVDHFNRLFRRVLMPPVPAARLDAQAGLCK